jgi:HNH endonuclease
MRKDIKNANDKIAKLEVNDLFIYDETSLTCIKWKHMRKGQGDKLVPRLNEGRAGGINKEGFLCLNYNGTNYSIPKIIWVMHNGAIPDNFSIKHLDGNRLNTQISNLVLKKDTLDIPEKYCEELKQFVKYDESSPSCLRWIEKSSRNSKVSEGDVAGSFDISDNYWKLHAFGSTYKVHRVIWFLHNGKIPIGLWIDHINGQRNDNRISNLRIVEPEFNGRNRTKNKNNSTGHSMISYYEGFNPRGTLIRRYTVCVRYNGKAKVQGFSCVKYGDKKALELAIACRDKLIQEVNSKGAGYTDRHGT